MQLRTRFILLLREKNTCQNINKWLFILVLAANSTDLTRTHGNGQEKIHVHLTSCIRYAHGLYRHTWKRSLYPVKLDYSAAYLAS